MKERQGTAVHTAPESAEDISRFADSYASFNRIINNLQRQYIALEEEFGEQNRQLVETNRKLSEMTSRNLKVNEFLNGILTSISAGVIAVDRQGTVTHFNPAASMLLGIPAKQVLERGTVMLFLPEVRLRRMPCGPQNQAAAWIRLRRALIFPMAQDCWSPSRRR